MSTILTLALLSQVTFITPTRTGTETFWDNAFRRAFTQAGENCVNDSARRSGCRIRLPCNTTLQFGSTLHVSRSHVIEGCGPESTILQFPYHITGVRFHNATGGGNSFSSTSPWDSIGGPAAYGAIRDLQIQANNHRVVTATVGHGVVIEAPYATLDNVRIDRFRGHGLIISADVNRSPPTNANHVDLRKVRVQNSYWSGAFIRGGDANANASWMLDASANCTQPSFSVSNPVICGGVVDLSFLGNTHISPHTASNGTTGYYFSGANQRATIIGSYAENDNPTNFLGNNVMASIGGITPWTGNGFYLIGSLANSLRILNDSDPNNIVQLDLGEAVPSSGHLMSFASYRNNLGGSPFRMTFRSALGLQSTNWFATDIGFLSSTRSWMVAQETSSLARQGQVWMPQPLLLGTPPATVSQLSNVVVPLSQPSVVSASGQGSLFRVSPRVGDVGGFVDLIFSGSSGSPLDISLASTITYTFTPPGRPSFTRNAALRGAGLDGAARYVIQTGDLFISGRWSVRGAVTTPLGTWNTNSLIFYVNP